jgi:hypothetical protein
LHVAHEDAAALHKQETKQITPSTQLYASKQTALKLATALHEQALASLNSTHHLANTLTASTAHLVKEYAQALLQ